MKPKSAVKYGAVRAKIIGNNRNSPSVERRETGCAGRAFATRLRRTAPPSRQILRRERVGHTLQTTALIHETYLKLIDRREVNWQNRAHFFGIAAQAMRRILVDYAKARHREKRGGADENLPLENVTLAVSGERKINLEELDQALTRLAAMDKRQGKIVELRYFGGLSLEEIEEVVGISIAKIRRDMRFAEAWLYKRMS